MEILLPAVAHLMLQRVRLELKWALQKRLKLKKLLPKKPKAVAEDETESEKGAPKKTKSAAEGDDEKSNVQLISDPCWGDSCKVYKLPTEKENFPMNYAVNSFGPDPDMVGTMNSLKIA